MRDHVFLSFQWTLKLRSFRSVTSVAGVIGSVGIPIIAPAALAAAAGFVLAQWLFMIYQET